MLGATRTDGQVAQPGVVALLSRPPHHATPKRLTTIRDKGDSLENRAIWPTYNLTRILGTCGVYLAFSGCSSSGNEPEVLT